jgi:hypothetical protein
MRSNPMSAGRTVSGAECDTSRPPAFGENEVLERAVAKVILLGEQGGISADEMILLLDSGLTVSELLEYVVTRAGVDA